MSLEPLIKELDSVNVVELGPADYLQASIDSEEDKTKEFGTSCYGWKYLERNIPLYLKELLKQDAYWELKYNTDSADFIEARIGKLSPQLRRQLESFIYIYNGKKRDAEEKAHRQALIDRGLEEITCDRKDLDKVKVSGVFEISKIGIMGSFDAFEEKEGTLNWCERLNCLMLIPKRSRTRGYPIRDRAYIRRC